MEERQEAGKTETTKENEGKQNGNKKSKKAPALEDNRRLTKSGVHAGEKRPAVADWRVAAKEHLTLGGSILYCNTLQYLTLGEVFRILIFRNITLISGNFMVIICNGFL